jgi:hypothetical protein
VNPLPIIILLVMMTMIFMAYPRFLKWFWLEAEIFYLKRCLNFVDVKVFFRKLPLRVKLAKLFVRIKWLEFQIRRMKMRAHE